ncbi:hypothetical protein A2630_02975 [Candidatus Woesebacteria bacterium RIFCSPHIGHO2_01_FULL_44_10]|uniref:Uncharacterized protein n=1 Tax=Candidatus Woesebacteria bacterium RIFCSPLOWO2_01_FULL_44_14 TaxID=1802525 RepID=A0A1F8C2P7_9BACT|nr:MAG: hypothetical protein A2630_02975 [Candidatus Woesebacteria bacterium RIFCSPHIGHO2_01_FULL_44_10]OGM55745.1 MAG: hypothetical protein A3F62_04665 [Candidatus Woesebacteria bacterium RIFCSPHIGHO2_12_FULL_44_11]OGM70532.1 MAG: hypothetical protein A2975_02005 [Candidatus Woesebacteria bacterium RIFCSPLOWO2_01_FULL_44_14]
MNKKDKDEMVAVVAAGIDKVVIPQLEKIDDKIEKTHDRLETIEVDVSEIKDTVERISKLEIAAAN